MITWAFWFVNHSDLIVLLKYVFHKVLLSYVIDWYEYLLYDIISLCNDHLPWTDASPTALLLDKQVSSFLLI